MRRRNGGLMPNVLTKKFQLRDWRSGLYLGHQFVKRDATGFRRVGDKRCEHCGAWFHWIDRDLERFRATGNLRVNYGSGERFIVGHLPNGQPVYRHSPKRMINWEPVHCGSTACEEYHRRILTGPNVHQITRQDQEQRMLRTFRKLLKRKLVG